MTYSLQSHEAAVVAFPMDSIDTTSGDIDDYAANEALQNKIRSDRAEFAYNIDGASDHNNEAPLITAIQHVTGQINELKATQRRLIAFGRHNVSGEPYSYASLGRAAGRSDVWAKDVASDPTAKAEALSAQNEIRPQPASIWQDTRNDDVMGLVAGAMGLNDAELRQMSTEELLAMQTDRSVDGDPKRPDQSDTQKWGEWLAIQNELNRRTTAKESN